MAALLVAMSVAAILMTAAMPVWKQMAQREKEAELVFRGQQYARAIELMQRKKPGALPPNIDVLVEQKFLRKKYKDPITGDDFQTLTPGQALVPGAPASTQPGGRSGAGAGGAGRSNVPPAAGTRPPGATPTPGATPGGVQGGIMGVASKSRDTSILVYNGRNHYNEWIFQPTVRTQAPGVGAPGTRTPGQQSGPGQPQRGRSGPGTAPAGGPTLGPPLLPRMPGRSGSPAPPGRPGN